jgi:hypothetical protein
VVSPYCKYYTMSTKYGPFLLNSRNINMWWPEEKTLLMLNKIQHNIIQYLYSTTVGDGVAQSVWRHATGWTAVELGFDSGKGKGFFSSPQRRDRLRAH